MNTAVGNELLQSDARDLAANRIKRGNDNCLGRIVDDQIDTGRSFQRADIAAFTADDAALHVLIGQGDHRDGRLSDVIGSAALDRHGDDVARLLLGVVLGILLDLANEHAGVMVSVLLDALDDHVLRLILGHLRHTLQLHAALLFQVLHSLLGGFGRSLLTGGILLSLLGQAVELILLALERRLARIQVIGLLIQGFLALSQTALAALHLGTAVANLAIQLVLQTDNFFLGLQNAFLLLFLSTALRVVQQVAGILFRAANLLFLNVLAVDIANCQASKQGNQYAQNGNKNRQPISHSFLTNSDNLNQAVKSV